MADNGPPNPPPNPNEPWLEALTFEQIAQLVNEVSPEVFYQRASAFDQAGGRLQDVLDQIRHEMNLVRESWTGTASDDFDSLVRDVTAKVGGVLAFLQSPGYGATLRSAGDQLADHQRRFRDLQGQKTAQESAPPVTGGPSPEEVAKTNGDSAKQILRDLRTAYWDIGNALPGFPYKPTTKEINDPNTVNPGDDQNNQNNNQNNQHHENGPNDTFTNGENGPGFQTPPVTNAYAFGGPAGPPGQSNLNNNVFVKSTQPGQHGGGGEFRLGGGDGPGGHHDQMLGRVDQDGQQWTVPGGGPGGPGMPGWPGQTLFAGGAMHGDQPVLGRGPGENRKHVLSAGLPAADEDGETLTDEDGETFSGVVGGVLGRFGTCQPGSDEPGTTAKKKDRKQAVVEEPREELVADLPETVSEEIRDAPVDLAPSVKIRTTTEAQLPLVSGQEGQEVTPQVATTAGISLTPQGTPDASVPPVDAKPAVALTSELDPGKSFMLTASHGGGGGGGVTQVAFDPEQHGLFAPGTATPDGLPGQVLDTTPGSAGAGQAAARTDPYGPGSGHMGGMPMSPMMGAMGGGMQQQNGRMAAMQNEPRPEVWDPATGAPVAVGRRAEQQQSDEPEERKPALTKEQVQAALDEKFAQLDRLSGRMRDGGK